MSGTLSPVGKQYFTDDAGAPLSAGLVYTYSAGTVTPATTYSDVDLLVPNANPIVLDSAGRCTIYLAASNYKYMVYDSLSSLIWTQDNIASIGSSQNALGEIFSFGGDSATPVTDTSYPSGATYDKLAAGTAIYSVDSTDLSGTYALVAMMAAPSAQTITTAIVNLADGAPDTALATCSTTDATGVRVQSGAITFATAGVAKTYGVKIFVTGGTGFGWAFSIVRTG